VIGLHLRRGARAQWLAGEARDASGIWRYRGDIAVMDGADRTAPADAREGMQR